MSKEKPGRRRAASVAATAPDRPQGGGSYVRDRASGKLERVEGTEQRQPRQRVTEPASPVSAPADDQQPNGAAESGQQEG